MRRPIPHGGRQRPWLVLLPVALLCAGSPWSQAQTATVPRTNAPATPSPRSGTSTNRPSQALSTTTESSSLTNRPAPTRFRPITKPGPAIRLTGGSRGTGDALVKLDVLAPEQVGLTFRDQPTLYWYQSRPSKARLEVAILQDQVPEPLYTFSADQATAAGLQRLDLASAGVRLAPGVEYQWVVALVTDPENRSSDLVASGFIQRAEPAPEWRDRLTQGSPETRASLLAEAGSWYDAVATLSEQLAVSPADPALLAARSALLRKAGLPDFSTRPPSP